MQDLIQALLAVEYGQVIESDNEKSTEPSYPTRNSARPLSESGDNPQDAGQQSMDTPVEQPLIAKNAPQTIRTWN